MVALSFSFVFSLLESTCLGKNYSVCSSLSSVRSRPWLSLGSSSFWSGTIQCSVTSFQYAVGTVANAVAPMSMLQVAALEMTHLTVETILEQLRWYPVVSVERIVLASWLVHIPRDSKSPWATLYSYRVSGNYRLSGDSHASLYVPTLLVVVGNPMLAAFVPRLGAMLTQVRGMATRLGISISVRRRV